MTRGPRLRPTPVGQELVGLTEPPDWKTVFGFDGPLELEIGCGGGAYALEYARTHPNVRYVVVLAMKALMTSGSVMLGSSVHCLENHLMKSRRDSSGFCRQLLRS
jgi:hypothetical protein